MTDSTKPPAATSTDGLPVLLTVAEVATLLRTTVNGIYARIERGNAPAGLYRDGRKILFSRDVLLASIAEKTRAR